jgi:integrase
MHTPLRLVVPGTKNNTVKAKRQINTAYRTREYLTEAEIVRLMEACKGNRYQHRDRTMVIVAYHHGLRVSELVDLRWDQVDFNQAVLHVRRVKNGTPSVHPLTGNEMRALRRLQREQEPRSQWVFTSERSTPFTTIAVQKFIGRLGVKAGLEFPVHPHMLRHACGFKLANDGRDIRALQSYLGHRNIQHTVRYAELAPSRFKGWWDD